MEALRLYQVDSFTREKFTGNPAGVVANADGLTDEQMQKIAREMNLSETVFIARSHGPDHDVHNRFFTPTTEVPICGHASIAAGYVMATEARGQVSRIIQLTGRGPLPLDIIPDGDDYIIGMTQDTPTFEQIVEGSQRDALIAALGITPADIDDRGPIEVVSTGHSKIMVPIKRRSLLHSLQPNMAVLKELSGEIGSKGYFVFTLDSDDPEILTHGRMFAPEIGINEDPVTGNAHGPVGSYLVKHGLAMHDGGALKFRGKQGEAMGRPGTVDVTIGIQDGGPVKAQIFGKAVIVFKTELTL